jgi:predicted porin
MNNKLKLAVAAALVAGASSANAGIIIPAGDWTLDIGGVVNAYYTNTRFSGNAKSEAGEFGNGNSVNNITTGLLPNYLSVSGKTRQNDLDVGFTISMNPGASTTSALFQGAQQENRQAFLTFGDASWGSIKLGKDLGIYASDAILNDQTLLGVGSGAGALAGNTTTLGRIGRGFMYADWKSQVAYSSPNFNGFNFTVGVTQAWDSFGLQATSADSAGRGGRQPAFEGKASYEWAGDVAGKVWTSFISQKVRDLTFDGNSLGNDRANAWDIGSTINVAGFGLTGYYGQGKGIGQLGQLVDGFDANGKRRDSDQWYVQGSYTIPDVGTKIAASYGESTLDGNRSAAEFRELEQNMWVIGAYHPITKHLNLVAEYSEARDKTKNREDVNDRLRARTISAGAILFF